MKWVLIITFWHSVSFTSSTIETKEIGTFPDKESCLKAAEQMDDISHPICGLKEDKK